MRVIRTDHKTTNTEAFSPVSPVSPIGHLTKRLKNNHFSGVLVPEKYHTCQADIIVTLLADLINQIIQYNDQLTIQPRITRFHSRAVPGISVKDYLLRTVKYLQIDNSVLLLILVFIDRISKLNIVTINSLTIHRFIIASISIATKQVSDVYPPNSIFAKIGGLSLQELNLIEMELCKTLNWRFNCPDKLLQNYYTNLVLNHSQYGFEHAVPFQPTNCDIYLDN